MIQKLSIDQEAAMKIPMSAVEIAVKAVNAGETEMSYVEHILIEAKANGAFNGTIESAVTILALNGFKVA